MTSRSRILAWVVGRGIGLAVLVALVTYGHGFLAALYVLLWIFDAADRPKESR